MSVIRDDIISKLQSDILRIQGFKPSCNSALDLGLGPIINSFPNSSFPVGAVHEFLIDGQENGSATTAFVSALLSELMNSNGIALWVSSSRILFPPALRQFGLQPDQMIFIDAQREKDVIWVMEEALKCSTLKVVVSEIRELSFTASRRLQLAVEESKVTGFVLRNSCSRNPTACVSRWKIQSMPSHCIEDMPGVGFPRWRVELMRIRNGKAGVWELVWRNGKFEFGFESGSVSKTNFNQSFHSHSSHSTTNESLKVG